MQRELNTIQKQNKLNRVFAIDEVGNDGVNYRYEVEGVRIKGSEDLGLAGLVVQFQDGARNENGSISGVSDVDLLEIVRDRLILCQLGKSACREYACALTKIEEALMWLNKRTQDNIK